MVSGLSEAQLSTYYKLFDTGSPGEGAWGLVLVERIKGVSFIRSWLLAEGTEPSHQEQPLFSNIYRVDW